ncbi:MAG: response regulator [Pseudomonadota bacterium]
MPNAHPTFSSAPNDTISRLILVEDDENVRRAMTMAMRARGFRMDSYRNATEFLMMNGQHGGDCMIIDYKMPRIDGLELMRRIRQLDDATPGIMITGFYSGHLKERALRVGYSDVLEKPTTPFSLEKKILGLLR